MTVLVTGATGFIGRRLIATLESPRVLARDPTKVVGARAFAWSSDDAVPADAMRGVDAIVNLAGEPVAERWTDEKKKRITRSRVDATRRIVEGIAESQERPKALVSASAVGFYGDRGDELLDENSAPGHDFLAEVCQAWEAEAVRAEELGVRVVRVRIGLVLARGEGFLGKVLPIFKTGLGGRLGDGDRWMPWIHVDDVVGLVGHAIRNPAVRGAMNATGPSPVTNADLTAAIAHALHRPAVIPAPEFAIKVALGELATVVLASQRVVPRVAEASGYVFRHPTLESALKAEIQP